jgi:hypothetical protein
VPVDRPAVHGVALRSAPQVFTHRWR